MSDHNLTLEEAKAFLSTCVREELRDHAFGDAEITWYQINADGTKREVASAYIGGGSADVWIRPTEASLVDDEHKVAGEMYGAFQDAEARALRDCGPLGAVERNDATGPAVYAEGETLPALTREGVRRELCGDN